jgi:hypothetical protein
MVPRTLRYLPALALLLAVCGCGGKRLVTAKGQLTYKGKPVPSTRVTFLPDDGGRPSHGTTDDDGHFTLKFSRTAVGVTPGKHTVFLRYDISADEEMGKIKPKASRQLKEVIASYGDPKNSPLHYEVTKDGDFFDIQLK